MSRPGPLRYLPSLDGLRALAVVAVIVYHANPRWLPGGFIGVETFFVISGYLITLLLVSESEETGRVDLRAFWVRRARRLLPALWLLLIGVTTYAAVFERGDLGRLRGDVVAAVLYGFNWFQIWTGTSYFTAFELVPLRHLWSLAVEEQYYLVWPLVMAGLLALGRRRLPAVGLAFAGGSAALAAWTAATYRPGRIGTIDETPEQYVELLGRAVSRIDLLFLGTPTRAAGLLLGAALATWWRPWRLERAAASRLGTVADVLGAAGTVALVVMALRFHTLVEGVDEGTVGYDLLFRGGFAMVDVASLAVVAAAAHPGARLTRLALGNAVMRWIGTRSYGLYLYHWPVFQMYRRFAGRGLTAAELVVLMAVACCLTEASYRWVEMPVRRGALGAWWRRFRLPAPPAARAAQQRRIALGALAALLPTFGVVSLATAEVRVDEITRNLMANEATVVDVLGGGDGSPQPAGPTTTVAGQVAPPTTTLDGQVVDVLAIGDSVMLGAANVLTRRGVTVDAMKSRPFRQALEIANFMKSVNRLGSVVIIHLGTNNTVDVATLDEIMVPLRDVPLVLFVTVHVPSEARQRLNNERIAALPERYENVRVLDWHAVATAHPEYLYSDRTHIRPEGQQVYADLIMQAIGRP
ncbi:MAG: acyltransferase family protein [Acidimicrobiia bacterium]